MKGTDVEQSARFLVGDSKTPYEFASPTSFISWINEGVYIVIGQRPDALLDTDGTYITIVRITALAGTISIDDKWQGPLADYVASRLLQEIGDERFNADKSTFHFNQCLATLKLI